MQAGADRTWDRGRQGSPEGAAKGGRDRRSMTQTGSQAYRIRIVIQFLALDRSRMRPQPFQRARSLLPHSTHLVTVEPRLIIAADLYCALHDPRPPYP